MKIAAAQLNVSPGETDTNTGKMLQYLEKASASGADVIVFPEMSDTGYDMPTILKTAQPWDRGPVSALRAAAKRNAIAVIAGVSERTSDGVYNGTAVIDKDGELIGSYRKTHLITAEPMLEHHFLKAGDRLGRGDILGHKIGLMTCYDIRFPEVARTLSIEGAEILFIPSAFPLVRLPHWTSLLSARAIENQVFVVACNRVGHDAGVTFCGTSTILDPYGTVVASASDIHESLIIGELNFEMLSIVRSQIKVHQDRRPSLYGCNV